MNVIDLFAGCGGMSLGFEMAGFQIPLAIEKDEWAANTYKHNHPNTKVLTADITTLVDLDSLGLDKDTIDGIVGGPPCQGFSLSGNRDKNDPRNSLFMEFVRFVKHFHPKFFVMENVPGILSMKTKSNVFVNDIILEEFHNCGYEVNVYKFNAAEFGVPQNRLRVMYIGVQKNIAHNKGIVDIKGFLFGEDQVTIEDAICDLPPIKAKQGEEYYAYPVCEKLTPYQKWARENSDGVYNHIAMNHSDRLVERFSHIGFGQCVGDVEKEFQARTRGKPKEVSGKVYRQNNMRPFPNKPSPTIPAAFQSNFVHPFINRNYTAREGARLQSFPDTYHFCGKRTTMSWEKNLSQYKQIGNAVPPLLAKGIAMQLKEYLYR